MSSKSTSEDPLASILSSESVPEMMTSSVKETPDKASKSKSKKRETESSKEVAEGSDEEEEESKPATSKGRSSRGHDLKKSGLSQVKGSSGKETPHRASQSESKKRETESSKEVAEEADEEGKKAKPTTKKDESEPRSHSDALLEKQGIKGDASHGKRYIGGKKRSASFLSDTDSGDRTESNHNNKIKKGKTKREEKGKTSEKSEKTEQRNENTEQRNDKKASAYKNRTGEDWSGYFAQGF